MTGTHRSIAGLDIGGSSTRCVIGVDGKIIERHLLRATNAILDPDSVVQVCCESVVLAAESIGVGLPGVSSAADASWWERRLFDATGRRVVVADDAATALLGAFGGAPGAIVCAGTGSIGRSFDGTSWRRIGGRGFLLGDEGSAYWIGRTAISRAIAVLDREANQAEAHDLVARALQHFNVQSVAALIAAVHRSPANRTALSRFALDVDATASDNDLAAGVLVDAANSLAEMAESLVTEGDLPVSFVGGVFGSDTIRQAFVQRVDAVLPEAPPEVGALLLAADPSLVMNR